jgi:hypothetical protein
MKVKSKSFRPGLLRRIGVIIVRILFVFFCVGGFYLSVLPQGRSVLRSALVLPALISSVQPAALVAAGEPIKHTQMVISSQSGPVYLDVYAPVNPDPVLNRARGGILIVPGVGDNRQVEPLINLSESLARTGLVVMEMTTPALIAYTVSVQDTDATVLAFKKLESLPGMAGRSSGMIAFSGGVPLICFAAADPRIRAQVASVTAFGGYFDTRSLLRTFGSRSITIDGKTEAWHPIDVPIQVLSNMTTRDLPSTEKRSINAALQPGGTPLDATELAQVSPGGQAIYHLLIGDEPERVDANISALPATIQAQLDQLSPRRVLAQIQAPIFLLHDRNDDSLPVTGSRAFDAALTSLHHPHEYVEFHIFDHVEVRSGLQIGQLASDGTKLFLLLEHVLYVVD